MRKRWSAAGVASVVLSVAVLVGGIVAAAAGPGVPPDRGCLFGGRHYQGHEELGCFGPRDSIPPGFDALRTNAPRP